MFLSVVILIVVVLGIWFLWRKWKNRKRWIKPAKGKELDYMGDILNVQRNAGENNKDYRKRMINALKPDRRYSQYEGDRK